MCSTAWFTNDKHLLTSPDLNNKGPLAKQKVVGSKGGLAALVTQYEAKYEISADMVPRR